MIVRGWSNGWHGSPVRATDCGSPQQIEICTSAANGHPSRSTLAPNVVTNVALSASFWRACTELRSADVGRWLVAHRLAPWPKGAPPHLNLEHLGGASF
jgi:hypothetical protein